jgi:hypothetical protein
MITLYNVIDIRTGQHYSVVIVKQRNAKWFVPAPQKE